jgi:hypothetical protein
MAGCLRQMIAQLNKELLASDLPEWFRTGPSDRKAREAAKFVPGKRFRDWNTPHVSYCSGSAKMLKTNFQLTSRTRICCCRDKH